MIEERQKAYSRVVTEHQVEAPPSLWRERTVQPLERAVDAVQDCLNRASQALLGRQANDGHWSMVL